MLTFLPKLPEDIEDNARCECDSCDRVMEAWECNPIEEFHKKMKVGDLVPAGECPYCGGLAYLMEDDDE